MNRDGSVDLAEFERAVKLQTPAIDPLEHVSKLLEDAGAVKAIAQEIMGSIGNWRSDPADALSNLEESEIARMIREAAAPVASALSKHFKDVKSKRRMSEISIESYANNAKYATMPGVYEGAFGSIDEFLQGLDAIGLPQPRVFEGMQDDFIDGEDSTDIFTTSNYGGIKTTPQTEWEYIVCPDMTKTYPGGRHPVKIETFMAAARVGEFDLPLSELGLSAGERAAVEVSCLRRVKTQLDLSRLKVTPNSSRKKFPSSPQSSRKINPVLLPAAQDISTWRATRMLCLHFPVPCRLLLGGGRCAACPTWRLSKAPSSLRSSQNHQWTEQK